jgi:luciferase family oxidoreductase group 1
MNFGILDFGTIEKDSNAISTIHQTIELAQWADKMGFSRYWLSEHHEEGVAWKSPEIVLSILAGYTEKMRIGAAGVLLALHAPLKIAQTYKLLNNLYDSRIDLGIAKGSTSVDKRRALLDGANYDANANEYYERINKIIMFMNDKDIQNDVPPMNGEIPDVWILGASNASINYVVEKQANFSLSLLHDMNALPSPDIIQQLKKQFYAQHKKHPTFNVAISAMCSNNKKRVEEIRKNTTNFRINFAGSPDHFRKFIDEIQQQYETDEIIVNNLGSTMEEKIFLMDVLKEAKNNYSFVKS